MVESFQPCWNGESRNKEKKNCFDGSTEAHSCTLVCRCTLEHGHLCVPTPTMVDEDSSTYVLAKLHTVGLISADSKGARRLRAGSRSCNLCGSWRRALGWQGVAGWRLLLCAFEISMRTHSGAARATPEIAPEKDERARGNKGSREAPKSLSTPYGG